MAEKVAGMSERAVSEHDLETIREEAYTVACQLLHEAKLEEGDILVVGCSTSEVGGKRIGRYSSPELGQAIWEGIRRATDEARVCLAAQCCEHLNRALIVERKTAKTYGLEAVWVVPQPKAGGSFATAAWNSFREPTAVEHIRAHAGIDIGDTLIGMHLKDVAVPVRIEQKFIGEARVVCARTRPKLIGGERAVYK
ncbi:MAG: TIGR01440 family protein [Clostridiales bacterium]|nr:TIGR01440 family protein [Clostridiales bacterium]